MSTRNKEYIELLRQSFNEEKFIEFIIDLLNLDSNDLNRNISENKVSLNQYKENIDYYKYIANYSDGMNNLGVFIVKLNDTTTTKARNMQRNFVASLLQKYNLDASLVAFYSDKETSWRFSFVKKELSFTDKGVKENLTSAKRYSYLVGEHESVHTAQEFLFKLLEIDDRKITLADIEKQFDVEKVTKRFFEEYKEKYLELKEYLDKNEDFQTEAKNCDFDSVEFAKKLMGQIVFLYFLQKKGWLGVQLIPDELSIEEFEELLSVNDNISQNLIRNYYTLDNGKYVVEKTKIRISEIQENIINLSNVFKGTKYDMPWGTGDKQFIKHIFKQAKIEHKNFFDNYLEQFFYKGLNEKRDNQYFPLFNCKIPFLNGGLFEPLNNYRWSSAHFEIPNLLFSNDDKTGILDFLNLYNFTIDEEEPLEKDVAVDPEMLGKIFENLLEVDDRKSKGAFYTPREIVYYMCQESLANYLVNKVNVDYNEIITFIKYGDIISQYDWELSISNKTNYEIGKSLYDNIIGIDKALIDVKVADPAVGSGAFPLGMLTEIVKIRTNLQIYMMIQNELGILNIDSLHGTNHLETDMYKMKLQTIENCIYAVDIESSAVDIAKLRLWLSLIVDYPNDNEPKPLPNLDCKIMQGNSLMDEFEGIPLFSPKMLSNNLKNYQRKESVLNSVKDINIQQTLFNETKDLNQYIEKLLELQREYFITSDNKIKKELKEKIDNIQLGMVEESLKSDSNKLERFKEISKKREKPWFIWQLEFYDVFKNNSGFDIVIGNPPYVDSESMVRNDKNLRDEYTKKYSTASGNWDLFVIFIELGFILSTTSGVVSFIIPNKLIASNYAKKLRKYINQYRVIEIRDFSNVKVFKEASVYPVTLISKKIKEHDDVKMTVMDGIDKINWSNKIVANDFHKTINWDVYFSEKNEYTDLISKIDSNEKLIDLGFNKGIEVKGASTVSEAYIIKEVIGESCNLIDELKFINTGTIDPFTCLWGIKPTQYIKGKYFQPVVKREILSQLLPNRYKDSLNPKIIIGGMTKTLECIYDSGNTIAGKSTLLVLGDEKILKYLTGILNSKLISFYYRLFYNSSSLDGGFFSVNSEQIKNLPIIIDDKKIDKVIALVEELQNEYDIVRINRLNEIVYEIYNLESDEKDIIEKYFEDNKL